MQGPEALPEKEHPGPPCAVQPGILENLLAWTGQGPTMSRELKNSRYLPQSDRRPIQPLPFPFILLVTQPQPVYPWRAVSLGHKVLQVQTLFIHQFFYTTPQDEGPLSVLSFTHLGLLNATPKSLPVPVASRARSTPSSSLSSENSYVTFSQDLWSALHFSFLICKVG